MDKKVRHNTECGAENTKNHLVKNHTHKTECEEENKNNIFNELNNFDCQTDDSTTMNIPIVIQPPPEINEQDIENLLNEPLHDSFQMNSLD